MTPRYKYITPTVAHSHRTTPNSRFLRLITKEFELSSSSLSQTSQLLTPTSPPKLFFQLRYCVVVEWYRISTAVKSFAVKVTWPRRQCLYRNHSSTVKRYSRRSFHNWDVFNTNSWFVTDKIGQGLFRACILRLCTYIKMDGPVKCVIGNFISELAGIATNIGCSTPLAVHWYIKSVLACRVYILNPYTVIWKWKIVCTFSWCWGERGSRIQRRNSLFRVASLRSARILCSWVRIPDLPWLLGLAASYRCLW